MDNASVFDRDHQRFRVVINDDGQYSIWPVDRPIPTGGTECGIQGTKPECLAYIDANWFDLRPRSMRPGRE